MTLLGIQLQVMLYMTQFHFVVDSFNVHTNAQHINVNGKVKASNTSCLLYDFHSITLMASIASLFQWVYILYFGANTV